MGGLPSGRWVSDIEYIIIVLTIDSIIYQRVVLFYGSYPSDHLEVCEPPKPPVRPPIFRTPQAPSVHVSFTLCAHLQCMECALCVHLVCHENAAGAWGLSQGLSQGGIKPNENNGLQQTGNLMLAARCYIVTLNLATSDHQYTARLHKCYIVTSIFSIICGQIVDQAQPSATKRPTASTTSTATRGYAVVAYQVCARCMA